MQIGTALTGNTLFSDASSEAAQRAERLRQQVQQQQETATETEATPEETASSETYGLKTFEMLDDDERAAFQRATEGMDDLEKTRAAQSVHLLATAWSNAQQMMNGGVTLATVDPDATLESALQMRGMLDGRGDD